MDWRQEWERHCILRVHPGFILDDEDRALIDIWHAYRRDGMGGSGHLPFVGGYAQQPCGLMRALEIMDAAAARVRERFK
jgi:hypothetical protein